MITADPTRKAVYLDKIKEKIVNGFSTIVVVCADPSNKSGVAVDEAV